MKKRKPEIVIPAELLRSLAEMFSDADWFVPRPSPVSSKKVPRARGVSLRRARRGYARKATRVRRAEAFVDRALYMPFWQAIVERIRAAYPSWSRTRVARVAVKWLETADSPILVSAKSIMRHTIDPGPHQTLPDDAARLLF